MQPRSFSRSYLARRGLPFVLAVILFAASSPARAPQEAASLGEEERAELDFWRRHGENRQALETLDEVLEEDPLDHASRALRSRCRMQACDYEGAESDARAAVEGARSGALEAEAAAGCARASVDLLVELGRAGEALGPERGLLRPEEDPRDSWTLARALLEAGRRSEARAVLRLGADSRVDTGWEPIFARARCQRALGFFERAAETLVAADRRSTDERGVEPDVLVELARVYFEAYGELDDAVSRAHSPADLCREALELARDHEEALLTLAELYRFNWQRARGSAEEYLDAALQARPRSIAAALFQVSAALDDGDLPTARAALERLDELAPGRRDVRTERAALAWIEHRRDEARALLDALVAEDGADSRPEREVGWHLLELYRFAEALPFLRQAVERDKRDWNAWTQLARAQANTGDEESARESLARATEVAEGRRNAWRTTRRSS